MLTSPFLRRLHAKYPDAETTFVTRPEYTELAAHLPYVAEVVPVDVNGGRRTLRAVRRKLRRRYYDHVFDLHNNFRTQYLRKGLAGRLHVYRKSHWRWMLLVGLKWNVYREITPVPERYIHAGRTAGLAPDNRPPELAVPEDAETSLRMHIEPKEKQYIAICPGAKHATKRWPVHRVAALAQLLLSRSDAEIVILGGKEDTEIGETIAALDPSRIQNLSGRLSLMESAAMLAHCSVAVSNDSGLMHIATAVGTPVAALFGCTVQEFGFFPYNASAAVMEVHGLPCRPCTHIGRTTCPKGHFNCMEEIRPQSVLDAVMELSRS